MGANYYKPGPATAPDRRAKLAEISSRRVDDKGHWFVAGNFVESSSLVTEKSKKYWDYWLT